MSSLVHRSLIMGLNMREHRSCRRASSLSDMAAGKPENSRMCFFTSRCLPGKPKSRRCTSFSSSALVRLIW